MEMASLDWPESIISETAFWNKPPCEMAALIAVLSRRFAFERHNQYNLTSAAWQTGLSPGLSQPALLVGNR